MNREELHNLTGVKESYELPSKLIEIILDKDKRELLFEKALEIDKDLSSDTLRDYYQDEQGDRKALKQDFTPDCLTKLIAKMLETESRGDVSRIADLCAGTGALTLAIWNYYPDAFYHLEEYSTRAIPFLLFNLAIRNITGEILQIDILENDKQNLYKLTRGEKFSNVELVAVDEVVDTKYDFIVSNPPYSMKWDGKADERLNGFDIPPKSKADYMFVIDALNKLSETGTCYEILPHGVLFRGNSEAKIRKKLVEDNLIDFIIGVPDNMFLNTGIPVLILGLRKGRTKKDKNIWIADVSKEFKKVGKQNHMTEEHIEKLITNFRYRQSVNKYSETVPLRKIEENEYNLNIPRYVDTSEEIESIDGVAKFKELIELLIEERTKMIQFLTIMMMLEGTDEEADTEVKEIQRLANTYLKAIGMTEEERLEAEAMANEVGKEKEEEGENKANENEANEIE